MTPSTLMVSLPLSVYIDAPADSVDILHTRVTSLPLPPAWIVNNAAKTPLSLCKLVMNSGDIQPRARVLVTLTLKADKTWVVSFIHSDINPDNCPVFDRLPPTLTSVSSIRHALSLIDSNKVCSGNSDLSFIASWNQRSLTLHNTSGNKIS